tara:strand:- start:20589 stop:21983 length:1395 start_codon:yes stop_codon:yes gene_type:complete
MRNPLPFRDTLSILASVAFAAVLAVELSASEKPDIVLYIADDHGRNDSSVYDPSGDAITPSMAKLASEGLTFNNAFVASPACGPSRSALMSACWPANNGAEHNHEPPRPETQTMVKRMQEAGYEVACFGKVHHSKWINWLGADFASPDRKNLERDVNAYLQMRKSSKPLLLIVGDTRTHAPWHPHDTYDEVDVTIPRRWVDTPDARRLWANYLGEVTDVDTTVGNIDRMARDHFKTDDFLFIYTSDHGHAWPFGKWNLYDWGVQVAFHARWPGKITANTRTDAMISWIDIFPTFLDLAGEKEPDGIDGKSFAKVLRGETDQHRDFIFTAHSGDRKMNIYPIRAVRDSRFKYIRNIHPDAWHTTHTDMERRPTHGSFFSEWEQAAKTQGHAKDVIDRFHRRPAVEFYDVVKDPAETNNLAGRREYADAVKKMAKKLDDWMNETGDTVRMEHLPYPLSEPYPGPRD